MANLNRIQVYQRAKFLNSAIKYKKTNPNALRFKIAKGLIWLAAKLASVEIEDR